MIYIGIWQVKLEIKFKRGTGDWKTNRLLYNILISYEFRQCQETIITATLMRLARLDFDMQI
jgi:hypothetical protein